MSYREDSITIRRFGRSDTVYSPPCHICGEPTFFRNDIRDHKYTCKRCKDAASIRKRINKTA